MMDATLAIPRSRPVSPRLSGSRRATISAPPGGCWSAAASAVQGPTPGTASGAFPSLARTRSRSSTGARPSGKPTDATIAPSLTIAATSASNDPAARSTATVAAARSLGAAETAVTNSVSC